MSKDELKLFQELYDLSIPKKEDSLEALKSKAKTYDINPDLNFKIMKMMLTKDELNDNDSQEFYKFFADYIQTLFYNQKEEIIKEIKKEKCSKIKYLIEQNFKLNEKDFITSYFEVIEKLSEISKKNQLDQNDFEVVKNLFQTDYFVDNYNINIPLIYGTNELIFSGLINNLYFSLCLYKKKEKIIKDDRVCISKFNNYPKNIIKKVDNKTNTNDNIISNMNIEEETPPINEKIKLLTFEENIKFITKFLGKISSQDFQDVFDLKKITKNDSINNYNAELKMNSMIFHLLYVDLILFIYTLYGNNTYTNQFNDEFFFEYKREKFKFFKETLSQKKFEVKDESGNEIENVDDIENKDYIILNKEKEGQQIKLNPYDYILTKFGNVKNFDELLESLSKPKNFSLYKFFKDNQLFNDTNLSNQLTNNVQEMLTTQTINELFEQYTNYEQFSCPYNPYNRGENKQFLKQTFKAIFYLPIPFGNIAAYTYKKFGLIFINNMKRAEKATRMKKNKYFCQNLNYIGFMKIVHLHEIVGHYLSTIIHSNNSNISTATPPNTFINYDYEDLFDLHSEYDGGDKGETLLFGNKIKYLFTKSVIFILDNKNYQNNLDGFRLQFLKENQKNEKETLDLNIVKNTSKIIKILYENNKDVETIITLDMKSLSSFRTVNFMDDEDVGIDDVDDDDDDDDDKENYKIGVLSYFSSKSHVFPPQQRIKK